MVSREEIENLAQLSRLTLSDSEVAALEKEFSAILDYMGHIAQASGDMEVSARDTQLHNVMREDEVGKTVGGTPEKLVAAAPKSENGYIVVRKIIQRDE